MATARIDIRLDENIKAKAEKASALLGLKSLTEYVVQLVDENATNTIAEYESMTLRDDVFDQFMDACEKAEKPNTKLQEAMNFAKTQGFT